MAQPDRPVNAPKTNIKGDDSLTPELFVQQFATAVWGVCLAHTKNIHDAEDIMQDVFITALRKFNTLRKPDRVRSWLLQIARRKCIDYYRKRRTSQIPDDIPTPSNEDNEIINRVHTAVAKLPQKYRETVLLYYLDGQKCAAVAQNLQISEAAVRRRLFRARLMLKEIFLEIEL